MPAYEYLTDYTVVTCPLVARHSASKYIQILHHQPKQPRQSLFASFHKEKLARKPLSTWTASHDILKGNRKNEASVFKHFHKYLSLKCHEYRQRRCYHVPHAGDSLMFVTRTQETIVSSRVS